MAINQISSLKMGTKFKKTPIGEIPVEWEASALKEVISNFLNGGTPDTKNPNFWKGTIPWVTGADFLGQTIGQIRRHISDEAVKQSATNVIPKGALLAVTRTGVGKLAVAPFDIAISQDITGLIANEKISPTFLYWVLIHHIGRLGTSKQGTSINGILRKDLESLPIALPTLGEQKKIAEILSSVDDAIEKADTVIAKTRDLKKALMQRLLTRGIGHTKFKKTPIGEIPDGWKIDKLTHLGRIITGGTPPTKSPHFWDGDYMFVTPSDINVRRFIHSTTRYVSQEGLNVSGIIPKDAVMVTCIASIGKMAIATEDCCTNQQINSVVCNERIEPIFLFYALKNREYFLKDLAGQTAVPIVNKTLFGLLDVAIPSINEQKKIAEILSSVDDAIEKSESDRDRLDQTKKSLMADLLTGRVRTV